MTFALHNIITQVQCGGADMNRYKIEGGQRLFGSIDIHGAKNAALPILAATIINSGKSVIHNCPNLSDIQSTIEILEILGCKVTFEGSELVVDSTHVVPCDIPSCVMSKTRSSTVFAGALAARCKNAYIAGSGGCQIGTRPIDIHLSAFKTMGMEISETPDAVICSAHHMKPCTVCLSFPSVGATENVMLASSLTPGCTTIINAAMEPEIVNLASYLRSIGVKVTGDGTEKICIFGTSNPTDGEVTIIPDRIVASTYAAAALISGGEVCINRVLPSHLSPFIATLRQMGAHILCKKNSLYIKSPAELKNIPYISTAPYPGFPTDAQPLLVSLMAVSRGRGIIREKIFENRFGHCRELVSMGADIDINGSFACIKGVKKLKASSVRACDLRCGASLCLAALCAEGTSYISETHYIDRGYESLCDGLKRLGAKAERTE